MAGFRAAPNRLPSLNHTYALVGLTPSESSLLESLFALDAEDVDGAGDALVPVGLGSDGRAPDLLIVNGDDLAVAQRLSAGYPRALMVLVGAPRGSQRVAWPVMPRPLDIQGVVAALSELDWPQAEPSERVADVPQSAPDSASEPPSMASRPPSTAFPSEVMSSAFAPTTASAPLSASGPPRPSEPLSARLAWAMSEVMPPDLSPRLAVQPVQGGAALRSSPALPDVLVVHARRDGRSPSLARGLRRMGYSVMSVGSPEQAVAEMERHLVPFVFFDRDSLGADFLPLARAFHALKEAPTQPPYLAVVTHGGSPFDRLRARMAGCAWMHVPIDRDRLATYLERRGLSRQRDKP